MPGYVIHLAVGKIYSSVNQIEDIKSFERGIGTKLQENYLNKEEER